MIKTALSLYECYQLLSRIHVITICTVNGIPLKNYVNQSHMSIEIKTKFQLWQQEVLFWLPTVSKNYAELLELPAPLIVIFKNILL